MRTLPPRWTALAACVAVLSPLAGPASAGNPDWLRPYIGAQVGYSWDNADAASVPPGTFPSLSNFGGVIGGVQAGKYLFRSDKLLAGVVADFNLLDASTNSAAAQTSTVVIDTCGDGCLAQVTTATQSKLDLGVDWKASLRGKLGYLLTPDLQVFATAGVAFAKLKLKGAVTTTVTTTPPPPPPVTVGLAFSDNPVLTGFVVGGGAEMMITPDIGAFWQVSYYGFGSETFGVPGAGVKVDLSETVFQVGINLYFN